MARSICWDIRHLFVRFETVTLIKPRTSLSLFFNLEKTEVCITDYNVLLSEIVKKYSQSESVTKCHLQFGPRMTERCHLRHN